MKLVSVDYEVLRHPKVSAGLAQVIDENNRKLAECTDSLATLNARLNIEIAKAKFGIFNTTKELKDKVAAQQQLLDDLERTAAGLDEIRRQRDELLASGVSLKSGFSEV